MSVDQAQISAAKRALLAKRLRARDAVATITPRPPGEAPPLSSAQERLWFLEQYHPGTTAYTIPLAVRLAGEIDHEALRAAVVQVAGRHESLRTRFVTTDEGLPAIVVDDVPRPEFTVTAAESEPAARSLVEELFSRPFELDNGPLLRVLLISLAADDHVVAVALHHAVADGWSCDLLLGEILAAHHDRRRGYEPPAAQLPVQYGDYARWQRARAQTPAYRQDLDYWRTTLAGVPPLDLPTDRPRPSEQSHAGAALGFQLDAESSAALLSVGASVGATPYMTLLAVFQVLLARHSGQTDFAVGSPVAGRDLPELEPVIGVFINTLAMRTSLADDPRFTEHLRRVRADCLDAYGHQELPFDQLVQSLDIERDVSRTPVFQVLFALQNYHGSGKASTGTAMTGFGFETSVTRFDLAMYLTEIPDGLAGNLTYSTALFDAVTVERMAGCFAALVASIIADPDDRVSTLNLLTPDARELLVGPSAAARPPTVPHRLLHEVVHRSDPAHPAVVAGDSTLSYGELERRSNQLAGLLRARGVGPDDRVAILLEPSVEAAVAILGVLKAGAAYLPLDPEHPADRLGYIVRDADVSVAVTDTALRAALPADVPALCMGTDIPVDADDAPIESVARPENLAYVIYTSGTTGRPKGVMVQHRQVLTYLAGIRERLDVGEGEVFALPQSLAFDFGITIFYLSLLTGGTLHLIPPRSTSAEFAALMTRARVDHVKLTPTHLAALLAESGPAGLMPRRTLILGGEAAPSAMARELAATVSVVNHYGPTETTVGVTTLAVDPGADPTGTTLPIGRPLPGARVYVLDEQLEPVPPGVTGEIHIGGDRLARGYLGQPGLTADRFVPDPYGPPGARMYRTGDLGSVLSNGELQFLGRRDLQVKVRGYRIELGEIEAALADCAGVSQAVVELRGDRLVGYLVADGLGATPGVRELRGFLQQRLPDYMVPARFVWLDGLPLKAHGKVDRAALPEPEAERPDQDAGFVPPRSPLEVAIAELWAKVLQLDRVGVEDDFFALGGHSLLAMRIVAGLHKLAESERRVTVMDLFKYPTVRGLAELLQTADDGERPLLHRLTPARPTTATLVCAPYGGGSAVIYKPLADALPDDWALYSIAVPGHELGEESEPCDAVARRCAEEIVAAVPGPIVLYGHCGLGVMLAVEIARHLEAAGRKVDAVYLGGIFPFARPRGLAARLADGTARLRSDRFMANALTAAGLDVHEIEPAQLQLIIRNRRRGTREAEEYFGELFGQTDADAPALLAPVISVCGERDPATEFHAERFQEWRSLTETTGLVVLAEAGHFFLKYRAAELATIVTQVHPAMDTGQTERFERRAESTWWWQPAAPAAQVGPAPSMRRFLGVAAGQLVSITGSALTEFAVPIWVYLQTGSLTRFSLFAVIGLLPGMLIAPVAGAVVDRYDRRRVMLAGDAAAATVQLTFAILLWTGHLRLGELYPLLACLSVALTFQRLAYVSAVPQLVPKRFLGHANGVMQAAQGTAQLFVPLVAAGLLAAIGLSGILTVDVISYAVALSTVALIRFPAAMPWTRRESIATEIREGVRFSFGNRNFRHLLVFFAVLNIFLSPLFLLLSPLVLSFGHLADVARASFAGGLGVLVGGVAMAVWGGPRQRRMAGLLFTTLALSGCCLITGLHANLAVVMVGAFGMSLCLTLLNGIYFTIIQVKVAQRFHGRVIALNTLIAWSTLPIGFGLIAPYGSRLAQPLLNRHGPLASTVGAVIGTGPGRGIGLLYLAFALGIAATALIALRIRTLAAFDEDLPDAPPDDLIGIEAVNRRTRAEDTA